MKNRIALVIASISLLAGCSLHPHSATEPSAAATQPTPHMPIASTTPKPAATTQPEAPFMFHEAALPVGFPGPGPVDQIVVKDYPAYRAARARASTIGGENTLFMTLFRHIKSKDIAMTAPVEMTYAPAGVDPTTQPTVVKARPEAMLFMYRTPTMGKAGVDDRVEVIDIPAMTVVSITHRGSYNSGYAAAMPRLQAWIKAHSSEYQIAGPPRFFGYNSPFVPWFLQIGEMQIPIRPVPPK